MYKKLIYALFLPFALLVGCEAEMEKTADQAVQAPPKNSLPIERIAKRVADRLPHIHLNRQPFDDSIATNALSLFLDSLDFDRSYFMQSDIDRFQEKAPQLDDRIREGDTAFAHEVFAVFKDRVTNRVDYVNKLLDEGFDMNSDESYRWKRDESPWPATRDAWDELWRKKIKNEYVSRVAASEVDAEDDAGKTNTVAAAESSTNAVEVAEETSALLSPDEFVRERYKQYQMLIENNFDEELVLERYLSAFTHSYDPHSDYFSPSGVEDFDINMRLSLVGIGAMLRSEDGMAKITKLIAGGPAEADGRLQAGDKIIAVAQGTQESVSILHWPLNKAVRLIRGEIGTTVVLTVIPADDTTESRTKKIDLVRAEVKLEEQAARGEVRQQTQPDGSVLNLGVLTLPDFYADFEGARNGDKDARRASVDVARIIDDFSTNGVDGVILDLRNDGGGSLAEAIDIAGFFIPFGPVVQVREQRGVSVLRDRNPTTLYKGPLIVLVNRLSASASEIVAAALQDYGRAVIVGGKKTHGKGSVQTVFPLSNLTDKLGSIKVTTANFYRIEGGSTQLRGVTPDIILPSYYDVLDMGEESLPNALPWTQVNQARFTPWKETVKFVLPELLRRSGERMQGNTDFETFLVRRDRIQKRMETPTVSLRLADRVEEIIAEKELDKLQNPGLEPEDGKKEEDPILDETLRILSDMVELSGTSDAWLTLNQPM